MYFLGKYARKYWKPFCLAILCLMVEVIGDLLQPTIMSKIVDVGVANKDLNYVFTMGLWMLGATGIGAAAAIARNYVSSNVSQSFGTELRADLFKKIHTFSFENIDKFETASLITRLTNDVTQIQNFIHGLMRIFVKAPLLCIGGLIMATTLNPKMSLIFVAIIPIIIVLITMSMRIGFPFFTRVQKALDKVNGVMREYLSGVRVVKAFNRFDYETGRFAKVNSDLASLTTGAMRTMSLFTPGIAFTVHMGIVAVLWTGAIRVDTGEMHVGQIIAFTNYMTQILFSLLMISNIFTVFVRAKASAERINEVMIEEPGIKEFTGASTCAEADHSTGNAASESSDNGSKGRVDFENVSFTYSGAAEELVLKNITFTCMPGEMVGIIGSTGSGKSTLVNLIPRFYDVTSGAVKVNGTDIRNTQMEKLREKIAVVPQKTTLFTGTITENIRWGRENASEAEIRQVAEAAQADSFISSFPEGYDTLLGQKGVNLSGGQKQRISIARALIKKPQILILDDCTSAVDVATEAQIREELKRYAENMTCIMIAQRITSVMYADRIIVLENGEMAGMGTHEELMQSCVVYREIFRSQIGKERI